MNGMKTDAPKEVEGTGYEKTLHGDDEIVYLKEHGGGRVTAVNINVEFGDWVAVADGVQDDEEVGYVEIGAEAEHQPVVEAAVEWMQANPQGVGL